ncbi:hypothetical protein PT974_03247 [Cladobotryum mycophilum]|uniref:Nucleoside phosphorylase domain-containing protein n=1 Tax=Cladobotryum mycophilum TaxID=491253 RepID=A0ABR0SSV0_9HYPO
MPARPSHRGEFKVAIICALPLEYDAVYLTFDEVCDEGLSQYGRAEGDFNNYTTSRIGKCNVVLTLLARMGKVSAASAATSLRSSFVNLRLALLVGVCGVSPRNQSGKEILLGDVIVSKAVVQHDFGRLYPDRFVRKDDAADRLGELNQELRKFIIMFDTASGLRNLEQHTASFLQEMQTRAVRTEHANRYTYPGASEDRLFDASYRHKHQVSPSCICGTWENDADPVCDAAPSSCCSDLGCDDREVVRRTRLQAKVQEATEISQLPAIHLGIVASGDLVLKSAADRDRIAQDTHAIAFEMESAGVWEQLPCIMVKGACDYADSHKNKAWQHFAAATAASTTKAILGQYTQAYPEASTLRVIACVVHHIPFRRNPKFVGRTEALQALQQMLFEHGGTQRAAVVGLGGIGKTQVALQTAYWTMENHSGYSIFWLPAYSAESFEQAYRQISTKLAIQVSETEDVKTVMQQYLSTEAAGKWLLIVDNADDRERLFGSQDDPGGLDQYLPNSEEGVTLFTTRSNDVALAVAEDNVIHLAEMKSEEARSLLGNALGQRNLDSHDAMLARLLDELVYLPLAISQAAAYIKRNRISVAKYLDLLHTTEQDLAGLMSRQFHDNTRYPGAQNAVATTWLVSFEQIRRDDPIAIELLLFLSYIEPNQVPRSILPTTGTEEQLTNAIGTLLGYAFLNNSRGDDMFDMHHLVHLATRIWARKMEFDRRVLQHATCHLAQLYSDLIDHKRAVEGHMIRHSIKVLDLSQNTYTEQTLKLHFTVGTFLFLNLRINDGIKYLTACNELCKAKLPENHPLRLRAQHSIAAIYVMEGRPKEALKVLKPLVQMIREDKIDNGLRLTVLGTFSSALLADGRNLEAIHMLENIVLADSRHLPENDLGRLQQQQNLAEAYGEDQQIQKTVRLLKSSTDMAETFLAEDDGRLIAMQKKLAVSYINANQFQDAIKILDKVDRIESRSLPPEDPRRVVSQVKLILLYCRAREPKKAFNLLETFDLIPSLDELISFTIIPGLLRAIYNTQEHTHQASQLHDHMSAVVSEILTSHHPPHLLQSIIIMGSYVKYGRWEDAVGEFEDLLNVSSDVGNKSILLWCCWFAGDYARVGQVHKSAKLLDKVFAGVEDSPLPLQDRAELLIQLSFACIDSFHFLQAPIKRCLARLRMYLNYMLKENDELPDGEDIEDYLPTLQFLELIFSLAIKAGAHNSQLLRHEQVPFSEGKGDPESGSNIWREASYKDGLKRSLTWE